MLELHELTRRYGGLTALDELTLTVDTGAKHAVIGPNGAGKTTVVNLIAGTVRPSAGRIIVDARTITGHGVARRARAGIGRTYQHPALPAPLTVAETIALAIPARAGRLDQVAVILDQAGLLPDADRRVGELPYGRQRVLELATVLARRPRLLLLDEPSAGLDQPEIDRLAELLAALPGNVTVLLIDHHLDLVWRAATTVTVLDRGRHLRTADPATIRADAAVQHAYLGVTDVHNAAPSRPARPGHHVTTGPQLLTVEDLDADHGGAPVLHQVTVHAGSGEIVGVLGRNGAGKSTLLNSIAGLHRTRTQHSVHLAGRPVPADPGGAAALGIAIVPQHRRLFAGLTVAEHLHSAATRPPVADAPRRWSVTDTLTLFPRLGERLGHRAGQLSGGEQQMLAIARAVLTGPRLLLLDEPSEGLAPVIVAELAATFGVLADAGIAVLLAEQHLHLVAQLADRIEILDHGRVALSVTTAEHDEPALRDQLAALAGLTTQAP
ncbi:ATP-binding cassette domain-containing protein [Dactylosporangium sp. CA-139114]|uniref:ATP-binding cassette domain-containing protein n=1 Tax=Dactylosporangium sp. CA-139114 TaxID=3239931 RepID=UPI003D978826